MWKYIAVDGEQRSYWRRWRQYIAVDSDILPSTASNVLTIAVDDDISQSTAFVRTLVTEAVDGNISPHDDGKYRASIASRE